MIDADTRAIEYTCNAFGYIDTEKIGPFKWGYKKGVEDCKKTLLEWAKKKYTHASINADATDEKYHYGEVHAFEELIDFINIL